MLYHNTRIAILAHPRSLSTALEFSFNNRQDTTIIHAPYRSVEVRFNRRTTSFAEIRGYRSRFMEIKLMLEDANLGKDIVVWKETSCLYKELYPMGYTPIFLVRDPRYSIPSYRKMVLDVSGGVSDEVPYCGGLKELHNIFNYLTKTNCHDPVVIDAHDLSRYPEKILPTVCEKVGIEFNVSMLHWKQNNTDHWDPVWNGALKIAYSNVKQSQGFIPREEHNVDLSVLPDSLRASIEAAIPIYDSLYEMCIKPNE
ncbi:uncharacterized protein LOC102809904 [Saccoglossus kowalevskii]|uniref:Branched-chain-amino-acid aminotransferase-like protein 1-like n=1 Tax=Saccoglossus kowalevskii TaxID=10224 RepID=A0ABM0M4F3_SACKO|nr:PREDICTED: branched-chain-amino-acid aminotransferase-like protein 1-like [Saccoglossus kowalevskii]